LYQRAQWEGEVQQLFTGGVMMHLFLGEQPDPEALKKLVYRLAVSTKLVYFSITPTITVCHGCGTSMTGYYPTCPKCGGDRVDHWSRIVGYYRPVRNWNPGKKAEFKLRVTY
ncbi:MAG: anaerobic ribonucleoside-triphosphate reductase, partial [Thermofilum sp.]